MCALVNFQDCLSWSGVAPHVMISQNVLLEVIVAAGRTGRDSAQILLMFQSANYMCHFTRTPTCQLCVSLH